MPRSQRICAGGMIYHVLNRANARQKIFSAQKDYEQFLMILAAAHQRIPMRTIGFCIMPNHWHMVLWPREDGHLSEFMRWLTVTHTQRWHACHGTAGTGHLYQGRFKSFPVQARAPSASQRAMGAIETGSPLLRLLLYVERNPIRSNLVRRAEEWQWGSLHARKKGSGTLLAARRVPDPFFCLGVGLGEAIAS